MPITYPLSLPSAGASRRVLFYATTAVSTSRSPFSFVSQYQEFAGQAWGAEVTLRNMLRPEAEQWNSFLLKLNGPRGTFLLGDYLARTPRGGVAGSPVVDGAGQLGQQLAVRGFAPGAPGVLLEGDYIELNQRLYKVLVDASADSSGKCVLDIWPRLRSASVDGQVLITTDCRGLFRLAKPTYNVFQIDETRSFAISFSAIEAI